MHVWQPFYHMITGVPLEAAISVQRLYLCFMNYHIQDAVAGRSKALAVPAGGHRQHGGRARTLPFPNKNDKTWSRGVTRRVELSDSIKESWLCDSLFPRSVSTRLFALFDGALLALWMDASFGEHALCNLVVSHYFV